MNKVEIFIKSIEKQMKEKKIKKNELYHMYSPHTIASIFNSYKGNIKTLIEISDFVDNYKK